MRYKAILLFLILLMPAGLLGCEDRRTEERVSYEVGGKVVRVEAARRSVTIAHDEIPGFMEAMTMPFDVRDPALLEGLASGDTVRFELVVQGTHAWIVKIAPAGAKGGS
ncbi:MAG: copper-binding protein [Deltaproteobacteria bacterium]